MLEEINQKDEMLQKQVNTESLLVMMIVILSNVAAYNRIRYLTLDRQKLLPRATWTKQASSSSLCKISTIHLHLVNN